MLYWKKKARDFLQNVMQLTYLLIPLLSSLTTTLLLHAMRSRSVAIWLRGALLCICRTPSIWPLRRSPTLEADDDVSLFGLLKAKTKIFESIAFWGDTAKFSKSKIYKIGDSKMVLLEIMSLLCFHCLYSNE